MPLVFPPGVTAVPVTSDLTTLLTGPRVVDYRFDLLDEEENLLGTLDGVQPSGETKWDYNAAIKGGGSINVLDLGQDVDWLNTRIRPVMKLAGAGVLEEANTQEIACGVFMPSAPVEDWSAVGRSWKIELLDKNSILDSDIMSDDDGNPVTYSLPAGTNVIEAVVALIEDAGEHAPAIVPGAKTLLRALTWPMGTTRLKIINELLDTANYFSLWVDGAGQYQATPYLDPQDRPPVYDLATPFSSGDFSLMEPDWTRDRDIYSIPNRYVAISQGDGENAPMVSVATNEDPASPYSQPSRGRWITAVLDNAEATTQADLDAIARRGLTNLTAVANMITVSHLYLPDVLVNRTVRFVNPDADLDIICYVTSTTINFDPVGLCKSELREVGT
jgi:hypothetical protein